MYFKEAPAPVFSWKDLHDRIVKIVISDENVECLEPGQAFALDLENGKMYLLAEWSAVTEKETKDG